jgi:hypothetical protein
MFLVAAGTERHKNAFWSQKERCSKMFLMARRKESSPGVFLIDSGLRRPKNVLETRGI